MMTMQKESFVHEYLYFCELDQSESGFAKEEIERQIQQELMDCLGFEPIIDINESCDSFDVYKGEVLLAEQCCNYLDLREIKKTAQLADMMNVSYFKRFEMKAENQYAFFNITWKGYTSCAKVFGLDGMRNRVYLNSFVFENLLNNQMNGGGC